MTILLTILMDTVLVGTVVAVSAHLLREQIRDHQLPAIWPRPRASRREVAAPPRARIVPLRRRTGQR